MLVSVNGMEVEVDGGGAGKGSMKYLSSLGDYV